MTLPVPQVPLQGLIRSSGASYFLINIEIISTNLKNAKTIHPSTTILIIQLLLQAKRVERYNQSNAA